MNLLLLIAKSVLHEVWNWRGRTVICKRVVYTQDSEHKKIPISVPSDIQENIVNNMNSLETNPELPSYQEIQTKSNIIQESSLNQLDIQSNSKSNDQIKSSSPLNQSQNNDVNPLTSKVDNEQVSPTLKTLSEQKNEAPETVQT